jgi:hypothetical protein
MTLSPQPTEDTIPFSDWLSINNAKVRNATLDELYQDYAGRYVIDAIDEMRRFPRTQT